MPRKLTKDEQAARDAHFDEHPHCWMCEFLGVKQTDKTELHHIAGRGKGREIRENYAALCTRHHKAIQSMRDAELVCLVLKILSDTEYCEPGVICDLRGRARSCWTLVDIPRAGQIMQIMNEVRKCH